MRYFLNSNAKFPQKFPEKIQIVCADDVIGERQKKISCDFIMAYSYRKYGYFKYGKKGYNWKRKKLTPSKGFRRSAANMTQNGVFNVSNSYAAGGTLTVLQKGGIASGEYGLITTADIAQIILDSPMHKALRKVFDQYRIEKVTIKLALTGIASDTATPLTMFSCVDRTGFASEDRDLDSIRSYGSYKERQVNGDRAASQPLIINISQTDVVGLSLYRDTYAKATFPQLLAGVCTNQSTMANVNVAVRFEIDAMIRYRGVRLSRKV